MRCGAHQPLRRACCTSGLGIPRGPSCRVAHSCRCDMVSLWRGRNVSFDRAGEPCVHGVSRPQVRPRTMDVGRGACRTPFAITLGNSKSNSAGASPRNRAPPPSPHPQTSAPISATLTRQRCFSSPPGGPPHPFNRVAQGTPAGSGPPLAAPAGWAEDGPERHNRNPTKSSPTTHASIPDSEDRRPKTDRR